MTTPNELVQERLIPREFMVPDEKAIGALVRQRGDKHGIPGIEA